jgi:hypothetical protein
MDERKAKQCVGHNEEASSERHEIGGESMKIISGSSSTHQPTGNNNKNMLHKFLM